MFSIAGKKLNFKIKTKNLCKNVHAMYVYVALTNSCNYLLIPLNSILQKHAQVYMFVNSFCCFLGGMTDHYKIWYIFISKLLLWLLCRKELNCLQTERLSFCGLSMERSNDYFLIWHFEFSNPAFSIFAFCFAFGKHCGSYLSFQPILLL